MQDLDQRTLRKCPRCGCGLLPTSPICDFCGGVLSHIAAVGEEVSGVICLCGKENDPTAPNCRACANTLAHTCPRCTASLAPDATSCPSCWLSRQDFFDECVRQDVAARTAEARRKRRAATIDDIVGLAIVGTFILVAWWQELRSDAWEWKAWLLVTACVLVCGHSRRADELRAF